MFKKKAACLAIVTAVILTAFPQISSAEKFTGEKFLKWPRKSQDSLIQNSITMIAIVAAQTQKDIARCIDSWYVVDEAIKQQRHGYILDIIKENPSYHPQGVILAILQKRCGKFKKHDD